MLPLLVKEEVEENQKLILARVLTKFGEKIKNQRNKYQDIQKLLMKNMPEIVF